MIVVFILHWDISITQSSNVRSWSQLQPSLQQLATWSQSQVDACKTVSYYYVPEIWSVFDANNMSENLF